MSRFVLDASLTLAWCFEDEVSPLADSVLDSLGVEGALAPAIWPLEVANALLVAERRKRMSRARMSGVLRIVKNLPVTVDDARPDRAFEGLLDLARAHGLSVYDASYLELALREGLPLATLDDGLQRAARQTGVKLVP